MRRCLPVLSIALLLFVGVVSGQLFAQGGFKTIAQAGALAADPFPDLTDETKIAEGYFHHFSLPRITSTGKILFEAAITSGDPNDPFARTRDGFWIADSSQNTATSAFKYFDPAPSAKWKSSRASVPRFDDDFTFAGIAGDGRVFFQTDRFGFTDGPTPGPRVVQQDVDLYWTRSPDGVFQIGNDIGTTELAMERVLENGDTISVGRLNDDSETVLFYNKVGVFNFAGTETTSAELHSKSLDGYSAFPNGGFAMPFDGVYMTRKTEAGDVFDLQKVILTGEQLPLPKFDHLEAANVTLAGFGDLGAFATQDQSQRVGFVAQWSRPNNARGEGLLVGDASGVEVLARSGGLTNVKLNGESTGVVLSRFGDLRVMPNGEMYFEAVSTRRFFNAERQLVTEELNNVFRVVPGKMPEAIVREGGTAIAGSDPNMPIVFGDQFHLSDVNASGQLVFRSDLNRDHPQVSSSSDQGLFLYEPDKGLALVAREGDQITGQDKTFGIPVVSDHASIDDAGQIVFSTLDTGFGGPVALSRAVHIANVQIPQSNTVDFLWTGFCENDKTNWHASCAQSNWVDRITGLSAAQFPRKSGAAHKASILDENAMVRIHEGRVELDELTAKGAKLQIDAEVSAKKVTIQNAVVNAKLSVEGGVLDGSWLSGRVGPTDAVEPLESDVVSLTIPTQRALTIDTPPDGVGQAKSLGIFLENAGLVLHKRDNVMLDSTQLISTGNELLEVGGGRVINAKGGIYQIELGTLSGAGILENSGTLHKLKTPEIAGEDVAVIGVKVRSDAGTVKTDSNTELRFTGSGSHKGTELTVAGNSTVRFQNGTQRVVPHSEGDGFRSTGDGFVVLENAMLDIAADSEAVFLNNGTNTKPGLEIKASTLTATGTLRNEGSAIFRSGKLQTREQGKIETAKRWTMQKEDGAASFSLDGHLANVTREGVGSRLLLLDSKLDMLPKSKLENQKDSTLFLRDAQLSPLQAGESPSVSNAGTVQVAPANQKSRVEVPFNSTGTVSVQGGVLELARGGDHTGATWDVAQNATLEFRGGRLESDGGLSITGAGTARVSNGTVLLADDTVLSTATLLMAARTPSDQPRIELWGNLSDADGGKIRLQNGVFGTEGNSTIQASSALIGGPGASDQPEILLDATLTTKGSFTMVSGKVTSDVFPGAALEQWGNAADFTFEASSPDKPISIQAVLTNLKSDPLSQAPAGMIRQQKTVIELEDRARIDNEEQALYRIVGSTIRPASGTADVLFQNYGRTVSGRPGGPKDETSRVEVPFNNFGTFEVQSGEAILAAGGSHEGGEFKIPHQLNQLTLQGVHEFSGNNRFLAPENGPEFLKVRAGENSGQTVLRARDGATVESFLIMSIGEQSAALQPVFLHAAGGQFVFRNGVDWANGTLVGNGIGGEPDFLVNPDATPVLPTTRVGGPVVLQDADLRFGELSRLNVSANGHLQAFGETRIQLPSDPKDPGLSIHGRVSVLPNSQLEVQNLFRDATQPRIREGSWSVGNNSTLTFSPAFPLSGLVRSSSGNEVVPTTLTIHGSGKVDNLSLDNADSTFSLGMDTQLTFVQAVREISSLTLDASSAFHVTGGSQIETNTIAVTGGVVHVDATSSLDVFELTLNGGSLNVGGTISAEIYEVANVTASGSGQINGKKFDMHGLLLPGDSPGRLTLNVEDFTLGAEGVLGIELAGSVAGEQYDQLVVQGTAHLLGNLEVDLLDGFVPTAADRFAVLTAADSVDGVFGNVVDGQLQFSRGSFDVAYGPNAVELFNFQVTGDWNLNGILDVGDLDLLASNVAAGSQDLQYDINGDQAVTVADADLFLEWTNRLPGDADFDGRVGFGDFLTMSLNFGANDRLWSQGDFEIDGHVGFGDFLALSTNFGQSTEAANVPEPSSSHYMLLLVFLCMTRRLSAIRPRIASRGRRPCFG